MLNIILDGKQAVIKKSISFEFVSENRRFSKSDSYTLEITFPVKDCRENIAIFGDLSRKDYSPKSLTFECEIIDSSSSFHKKGSVIITEFSDAEVKCQFLEGRSGADITSPIADIYINEIEIASPSSSKAAISPLQAWDASRECVAIPWVNNDSGNIQNKVSYADGVYKWDSSVSGLSWFPYLTTVIKKVCEAVGYSYDISEIENNIALKYLLVCNALPAPWYVKEVARALPHWTVEEFFSKLEDFFFGKFIIDHTKKSITYISPSELEESVSLQEITLDINEFSAEVFVKDSECTAIDVANVKYKPSDHALQKFYDCPEKIKKLIVVEFESLQELVSQIKNGLWSDSGAPLFAPSEYLRRLYYIKDEDKYFCAHIFYRDADNKKTRGLQGVNEFGERIIDSSKYAHTIEIEIVPARIDYTDPEYGLTLFCDPGDYSEENQSVLEDLYDKQTEADLREMFNKWVENGAGDAPIGESGNKRKPAVKSDVVEEEEFNVQKAEYYDRINIGWWNGEIQFNGMNPFPNVSDVLAVDIDQIKRFPFSLSLTSSNSPLTIISKKIEREVRYNISFLADALPDTSSIFLIKGKKYVCEKLTATFTERGMSSLVKGVFWRIN